MLHIEKTIYDWRRNSALMLKVPAYVYTHITYTRCVNTAETAAHSRKRNRQTNIMHIIIFVWLSYGPSMRHGTNVIITYSGDTEFVRSSIRSTFSQ